MKEKSFDCKLSFEEEDLFSFIESGNINEIEEFLKNKINIWDYRDKNNDNSTVLHLSVSKNSYLITKMFIEYCKVLDEYSLQNFINETNNNGITALHYASFTGNIKIIQLLIDNGAILDIKTKKGLNIIHYCAQGNKPNSLMYFYIRLKDNYNFKFINELIKDGDDEGATPLHWAAYSNAEDVMMYLINLDIFQNRNQKQEFIDKMDKNGYTPLHLSVKKKSERLVKRLLQNGASSDISDNKHRTPLDLAFSMGNINIMEILRKNRSCQICSYNLPIKPIKKSPKLIIFVFFFQFITIFILYFSLMPIVLHNNNNENNIVNKILFFILHILFILFFTLYGLLLAKDPGEIKSSDINKLKELLMNEIYENKSNEDLDLKNYCYKCFIKKSKTSKHCIICDK